MDLSINLSNHVAIIGDIVNSKKIENRNIVQKDFKNILRIINYKYSEDIASDFTITMGDSFQGLLKSRKNIFKIICEIELALSPTELRFGIGIGDITTDIIRENSLEVDGPAFHRARAMIVELEQKESQYNEPYTNLRISTGEENIEIDRLINSTLSVCSALKSKWTDRQKQIIEAYMDNEMNQYKAANALNIGQSSVNKALINSLFYSYKGAIDTVSEFLGKDREKRDD